MRVKKIDRTFLLATVLLVIAGLIIFISAAFALLTKTDASFGRIALKQIIIGIVFGTVFLVIAARIPYGIWRRYAFYIFLCSIGITFLVFVPGLGFKHGGAYRWISIASLTLQPAEFLKIGAVIYFAAWAAAAKDKIRTLKFGLIPFVIIVGLCGAILLKQPDTGTFLVLFSAVTGIYIAAGCRLRDLVILLIGAALLIIFLAMTRPYLMERFKVFLNPADNAQGSGYQIQQSLLAIGSGGLTGRGFGQSIQKFNFLPEQIGDSIFSVAAEEFGFIGSVILIGLYLFLVIRGMKIAGAVTDTFGRLLVVGIVILISAQAFINIGSMLGVLPLTGIPLTFVSHGGTALFFALLEAGIVLSVSRYRTI